MSEYPKLSTHTFEMVLEGMNAIRLAECEEWVKDFDDPNTGFMFCSHHNIEKINNNIKTSHSGGSYASTMRNCQYFLSNMDKWQLEVNSHTNTPSNSPETN